MIHESVSTGLFRHHSDRQIPVIFDIYNCTTPQRKKKVLFLMLEALGGWRSQALQARQECLLGHNRPIQALDCINVTKFCLCQ